jgi:hypothetical protein
MTPLCLDPLAALRMTPLRLGLLYFLRRFDTQQPLRAEEQQKN